MVQKAGGMEKGKSGSEIIEFLFLSLSVRV